MATVSICELHGSNLRQLILLPAKGEKLYLPDLYGITQNCPYLEELTITISRSRGDSQEFARYKTLGLLSRLQSLVLRLDASDIDLLEDHNFEKVHVTPSDPSFDDIDQNYFKQNRLLWLPISPKRSPEGCIH
jgi:hypothetical protein